MLTAQLVKNLPAVREDPGSIPGSGRFPWRRDRLPTPVFLGFPCGSAGKESACNTGDLGSIPGLGKSPGEGKATHSSILAWRMPWTTVHGVTKSRTRLSHFHFHFFVKEEVIFGKLTFFQFLGILLKEFLDIVRKKKEAQVYRNEVRHIFTAFDRHCKYL